MTDRRTFLKALAASGAITCLPDTSIFGQDPSTRSARSGQAPPVKLSVPGGAIDVHHHFQAPGMTGNRPWSPELTLSQMEKFNIGVAILSMTQNGNLLYDNTPKGREAVRRGNDYGADLVQKHPGKFGQLGGIPMPDGVMFRYPNLTFITAHSGGTVPMLVGRMKDRVPQGSQQYLPNGLYAEVRKWYFDVAHATFPWPFAAAKAFMPESQLLFGTDYSPEPIESTVNELPGLKLQRPFELALLRGNAERLFPKFKAGNRKT